MRSISSLMDRSCSSQLVDLERERSNWSWKQFRLITAQLRTTKRKDGQSLRKVRPRCHQTVPSCSWKAMIKLKGEFHLALSHSTRECLSVSSTMSWRSNSKVEPSMRSTLSRTKLRHTSRTESLAVSDTRAKWSWRSLVKDLSLLQRLLTQ